MEYLKPKFTLPTCGSRVTQEEWDRIFLTEKSDAEESFPVAISQADGWVSDGLMAGGTRDTV